MKEPPSFELGEELPLSSLAKLLVSLFPSLIFVWLLMGSFLIGGWVAGVGLHDPDTCWLLAMGKFIYEHRSLPSTDPFSYTFASQGAPFVIYQWLAELVFYVAYRFFGLSGLLAFAALFLTMIFFTMPLMLAKELKSSLVIASIFGWLAAVSASFHFLVRPEIFSYGLLAALLFLIQKERYSSQTIARDDSQAKWGSIVSYKWEVICFCAGLLLLWCNLHSGFVLGLIALALWFSTDLARWLCSRLDCQSWMISSLALLVCAVITLINPKGFALWTYLPGLFFSPINAYIVELKPIGINELKEFTYYPFISLIGSSIYLLVKTALRLKSVDGEPGPQAKTKMASLSYSALIVALSAVAGLCARRIAAFSAIFLLSENIYLVSILVDPKSLIYRKHRVFRACEAKFSQLISPIFFNCFVIPAGLSLFGTYFVSWRIIEPVLPQNSIVFSVPTRALEFLSSKRPSGRLFNDAQLGDVLIWYLPYVVPVFIDTRYDMYGLKLVKDYQSIRYCEGNFNQLLKEYGIDWTFLPKASPLAKVLKQTDDWAEVYADDVATISQRSHKSPHSSPNQAKIEAGKLP